MAGRRTCARCDASYVKLPQEKHKTRGPHCASTRVMKCVAGLVAQAKIGDDLPIAFDVGALQVVQVTAALADHLEESPTPVVVLGVLAEVIGQEIDPFREHADLDLRRARVGRVLAIFFDRGGLYESHWRNPKFFAVSLL